MRMRRLLWLPVVAQLIAIVVALWRPTPHGFYAQIASLLIMLAVYAVAGIARLRYLRHRYRAIQQMRASRETAFRNFADAQLSDRHVR
jgi:hypothetical protein